jgi:hypothetical protein
MMHRLQFTRIHQYASRDGSVTVPVVLRSGANAVDLVASVDTGASYCLFESAYAAELGFKLTDGILTRFRAANSNFDAYGHEAEVEVLGVVARSVVYFSDRVAGWIVFALASSIMTARSTWQHITTTWNNLRSGNRVQPVFSPVFWALFGPYAPSRRRPEGTVPVAQSIR